MLLACANGFPVDQGLMLCFGYTDRIACFAGYFVLFCARKFFKLWHKDI